MFAVGVLLPTGACSGRVSTPAPVTLTLRAENIRFDRAELDAPAGVPIEIVLDNRDNGIAHDIQVKTGATPAPATPRTDGPSTQRLELPGLSAGTYAYLCTLHAQMTGKLNVR